MAYYIAKANNNIQILASLYLFFIVLLLERTWKKISKITVRNKVLLYEKRICYYLIHSVASSEPMC